MLAVIERGMILEQRILVNRPADVMRDTRHALRFEDAAELVRIRHAQHVKPPRMLAAGCNFRQAQSRDAGQALVKPRAPASAPLDHRIELAKLRQRYGALQL